MLSVAALVSPSFAGGLLLQICHSSPPKAKPPVLVAIQKAIASGTPVARLADQFPTEAVTLRALAKLLRMGKVDRRGQSRQWCPGISWMSSRGHIICVNVALR